MAQFVWTIWTVLDNLFHACMFLHEHKHHRDGSAVRWRYTNVHYITLHYITMSGDPRETSLFLQKASVILQRYNAVVVRGNFNELKDSESLAEV